MSFDPMSLLLYASVQDITVVPYLFTIDVLTGVATPVDPTFMNAIDGASNGQALSFSTASGGLFAIDSLDIQSVNKLTGAGTTIAALAANPGERVNAMDFLSGTSYVASLNLNDNSRQLVQVDVITGAITNANATQAGLDGLAFA
jgi:hypothetical protein